MKRWMISWDPDHSDTEPLVFASRGAADAKCAEIVAGLSEDDLHRPLVVEVVAGVLDVLQTRQAGADLGT
jgi:hypothetical protein